MTQTQQALGEVPVPTPVQPMNTLAIVAFIGSFFLGLAGIICGHIALGQIKRTGERGRGLALAGTIIGYVVTAFTMIGASLAIVFLAIGASLIGAAASTAADERDAPPPTTSIPEAPLPFAPGYSTEFCDAFEEMLIFLDEMEDEKTADAPVVDDPSLIQKELEFLGELALIDSPNREVYERSHNFLKDPESLDDPDGSKLNELINDRFSALSADAEGCRIG